MFSNLHVIPQCLSIISYGWKMFYGRLSGIKLGEKLHANVTYKETTTRVSHLKKGLRCSFVMLLLWYY